MEFVTDVHDVENAASALKTCPTIMCVRCTGGEISASGLRQLVDAVVARNVPICLVNDDLFKSRDDEAHERIAAFSEFLRLNMLVAFRAHRIPDGICDALRQNRSLLFFHTECIVMPRIFHALKQSDVHAYSMFLRGTVYYVYVGGIPAERCAEILTGLDLPSPQKAAVSAFLGLGVAGFASCMVNQLRHERVYRALTPVVTPHNITQLSEILPKKWCLRRIMLWRVVIHDANAPAVIREHLHELTHIMLEEKDEEKPSQGTRDARQSRVPVFRVLCSDGVSTVTPTFVRLFAHAEPTAKSDVSEPIVLPDFVRRSDLWIAAWDGRVESLEENVRKLRAANFLRVAWWFREEIREMFVDRLFKEYAHRRV